MSALKNKWVVVSYEGTTPGGHHKYSLCRGEDNADDHQCWCHVVAKTKDEASAKAHRLAEMLNHAEEVLGEEL